MTFWQPIRILLRVRSQVARHKMTRNPTAFLGTLLLAVLLAVAALHTGDTLGASWSALPDRAAETGLERLWMTMQCFWLLALLLPGGIALLGQPPSGPAL